MAIFIEERGGLGYSTKVDSSAASAMLNTQALLQTQTQKQSDKETSKKRSDPAQAALEEFNKSAKQLAEQKRQSAKQDAKKKQSDKETSKKRSDPAQTALEEFNKSAKQLAEQKRQSAKQDAKKKQAEDRIAQFEIQKQKTKDASQKRLIEEQIKQIEAQKERDAAQKQLIDDQIKQVEVLQKQLEAQIKQQVIFEERKEQTKDYESKLQVELPTTEVPRAVVQKEEKGFPIVLVVGIAVGAFLLFGRK